MKLTRKLIAAMLSVVMVMSLVSTALAAEIQATYDKASYYDIAVTAYSRMLAFQNGGVVAAADQNKKYGLIDRTGKVILPFEYASVWALDGGLFGVAQTVDEYGWPSNFGVVNASGEAVLAPSDDCFSLSCQNGIIRVGLRSQSYYQYYTTDWKTASEDDYWGSDDSGGYQWVDNTPPELAQYDWYNQFGSYYKVWKYDEASGKYLVGVLDSEFKEVVALGDYEYVGTPNENGYVSITKQDGSTDIQKDGKVVKTFTDKEVTTEVYYRHMVFTTTGEKYGMMNVDGKILLEEKYNVIDADANGYIRTATYKEDSWVSTYGLYTQEAEQVFADEYSELSYLADGKYRLHKDQYFGVSLVSGATATPVIPLKYLDMRIHTLQFIELYDGSKYSVVDLSNNVVVPESSQKINAFKGDSRGLASTIDKAMWLSEEWDGYTKSVLPFLSLTDNGWVTVYADYKTGEVTGQLNVRASNIDDDGWFAYQDASGLYGFGRVESAGATPTPSTPAATKAVLSPQGLEVDGETIDCEKYNIADRNYFKLRDLAKLLSGTGSQFEVGYDEATATVSITTGQEYTPNGTELLAGVDNSASAQPSSQAILINGEKNEELTVYNIGGSNFFQLRELGDVLGFEVDYDQDTNTAIVRSTQK